MSDVSVPAEELQQFFDEYEESCQYVEEPPGGSALAIWPLRVGDAAATQGRSVPEYLASAADQVRSLPYRRGALVLHDGLTLHAIELAGARADGPERRITLQGHGVLVSGQWLLYW